MAFDSFPYRHSALGRESSTKMDAKRGIQMCRDELNRWESHTIHLDRHAVNAVLSDNEAKATEIGQLQREVTRLDNAAGLNLAAHQDEVKKLESIITGLKMDVNGLVGEKSSQVVKIAELETEITRLKVS